MITNDFLLVDLEGVEPSSKQGTNKLSTCLSSPGFSCTSKTEATNLYLILFISFHLKNHDRDFLDGLVKKVYEFGGGKVTEHLEDIYGFLAKKKMESLREIERK